MIRGGVVTLVSHFDINKTQIGGFGKEGQVAGMTYAGSTWRLFI